MPRMEGDQEVPTRGSEMESPDAVQPRETATDDVLNDNDELQKAPLEQDISKPVIADQKEASSALEQCSPSNQKGPTKSPTPAQDDSPKKAAPGEDDSPKKALVPSSPKTMERPPEPILSGDVTSGDVLVGSSPL